MMHTKLKPKAEASPPSLSGFGCVWISFPRPVIPKESRRSAAPMLIHHRWPFIRKGQLDRVRLAVFSRRSKRTDAGSFTPGEIGNSKSKPGRRRCYQRGQRGHLSSACWLANPCPNSMECFWSPFGVVNIPISENWWLCSVTRHMKGSELPAFIASHFCKILPVLPVNSEVPFVWNILHSVTHNVTDCHFLWTPCSLRIISFHGNSRGWSTILNPQYGLNHISISVRKKKLYTLYSASLCNEQFLPSRFSMSMGKEGFLCKYWSENWVFPLMAEN